MKSSTRGEPKPRAYRMVARAEASEQTAARIYEAAAELFRAKPYAEVTLQEVASRAGVSLQTVLRRFGSKDQLFAAAGAKKSEEVAHTRTPARADDLGDIVAALVASYEQMGDLNWRALCEEQVSAVMHEILAQGRANHRAWVEQYFAHLLPPRARRAERDRRVALLGAVTDVYVWKLFRRDHGMSRAATAQRMTELVAAVARAFEAP